LARYWSILCLRVHTRSHDAKRATDEAGVGLPNPFTLQQAMNAPNIGADWWEQGMNDEHTALIDNEGIGRS